MAVRLLNVSVVYPPALVHGGPPVASHGTAKAVASLGHHVLSVATGDARTDGTPILDSPTAYDGIPVVYCSRLPGPLPFLSPALGREVAERLPDFDVVSIRSSWTFVGPMVARHCRKARKPYIAYPEGNFDPWALRRSQLRKRVFWRTLDRDYFRHASAIVALTCSEADSIRRMGLTNRVEVIPNGVAPEGFDGAPSRGRLDELYPQLRGRRVVLFLGRIHPKKGLISLVDAFGLASHRLSDLVLVIAGPDEGGYRPEVEARVCQAGLSDRVEFVGLVSGERKRTLLANAEMFVLPSLSEGLPIAVLEALASRIPVVVTGACNLPEVRERGAGIEVGPAPESIARAIWELATDGSIRAQMGRNGRRLIEERFSWTRVGAATAALCSDLI